MVCAFRRTGNGLQIQTLEVPNIADPRWEKVTLRCKYDLGGKDLYSVTWYKDGIEFFKFMPGSPGREYYVDGVHVDISHSDHEKVTLLGPNTRKGKANLAGSYGCEVSSEGPNFQTDYRVANMSVAVPPKGPPILDGVRPSYEVGEILEAECTSGLSYPPAVLTFILNGKEVNRALTKDLQAGYIDGSVISSTRLGLTVRLERYHFPGGSLSLVCRSTLPGIANSMAQETSRIATLAASNQRLAQEPPKSGSRSKFESYPALICWLVLMIHAIHESLRV
ncbi:hypothetical protein X777_15918 [Ooceraea biroi]|uniref:Ig-like domain-containing protein n=1 Tax=Ooceraea biroi TaxID=2015173 RepID=A0A026WT85_OOCBI|nr:hypothetical protein X777_15918 [Ooceraea biroi]